jgi:hypothetical protein
MKGIHPKRSFSSFLLDTRPSYHQVRYSLKSDPQYKLHKTTLIFVNISAGIAKQYTGRDGMQTSEIVFFLRGIVGKPSYFHHDYEEISARLPSIPIKLSLLRLLHTGRDPRM